MRFLLPDEGTTFNIPDTIAVRVQVSDDRTVRSVVVEVVDEAGSTIASAAAIGVDAATGTVDCSIPLMDQRARSGTYTLIARATDGMNDGRGFRSINVLEAPLRSRAIFLSPAFSNNETGIWRVDSTGLSALWTNVSELGGIAVDGHSQHLMVAGTQFAPMQALPTHGQAFAWQVAPPSTGEPGQFTALTVDPLDHRTYLATRDGFIRGYTGEGLQRFTAQCLIGHRCEDIVLTSGRVATWQSAAVGGASKVVTYTVAGTVQDVLPMEHERVALFQRSEDDMIHFANVAGSGLIEEVNVASAGTPDLRVFNGEAIRSVARMDEQNFMVALPSRIVRFNLASNSITEVVPAVQADALAFDRANGVLLAAQGSSLIAIDPVTGATNTVTSIAEPIAHILPLLNR